MAKMPPDIPYRGDRLYFIKDAARQGVMKTLNEETNWCQVKWDDSEVLQMCHRFELKKV
jgi:hypothetical protein